MHDWPDIPVQRRRRTSFRPPHCPWAGCSQHQLGDGEPFAYRKVGTYQRKGDQRIVQRYRCAACKRTFSQQTFDCTYYLKRPKLLPQIFAHLNGCSAHRQIARSLECSHQTVNRMAQRIGRHAMLLHATMLERIERVDEPIVFDHFETFAYSQWDRVAVATPVGRSSRFLYGLESAPHKRAGRVSPFQQKKRDGKNILPPPPGEMFRSTRRVLDLLAKKAPQDGKIRLISDGHKSYVLALGTHSKRSRFEHEVYPNPKRGAKGAPRDGKAIARDQAMFEVDQLHGFLRHSSANHKRETIAFARRENAIIERGYAFAVSRNLIKGRSERQGDRTTPAMTLGLTEAPWSWQKVLARRLFFSRVAMPPGMMTLYRRQRVTPALGRNAEHALKNAF